MTQKITEGAELQTVVDKAISTLVGTISSTLGPKGRNVILGDGKAQVVTKDGATVSRFIAPDDPTENVIVQILKQAAEKTNKEAGDGTTTTTILAGALLEEAREYLEDGLSVTEIRNSMTEAVTRVCRIISEQSRAIETIEDIENIATIAANNDRTIGKLIALAVDKVGKDGAIKIEEARSLETRVDAVDGFRFPGGICASKFITEPRLGLLRYENPLLLVTDHPIELVADILPALEIANREKRPIVIIAESIVDQALASCIYNIERGTMKVAACQPARYGEERQAILSDLALASGARFISRGAGNKLSEITLNDLGSATSIESSKAFTVIANPCGDAGKVEEQIEQLKVEIQNTDDIKQCEKIQDRIVRLASSIAIIRVGGATDIEVVEKKHRIEDALEAVRSAQFEGIVPGGGATFWNIADTMSHEDDVGSRIISEAIREPMAVLARNSDLFLDDLITDLNNDQCIKWPDGIVVDAYEEGIVDPAKVLRCALQNAASVAGTLLTAASAVVQEA